MEGRVLSHYRILEKIGAGGMGEVYRAHDEHLDRDIAIKVLPAGTLSDEAKRKRFRKEAQALSRLNHPNIGTVHDFDTHDNVDFLVMEYVAGEVLSQRIHQGPLPEEEVLRLGVQLADALAAAHDQGIVHRDLKPGNLKVTPDGRLKVLDFGLATLVASTSETATTATVEEKHTLAGTPPYMAPEQWRGEPVDFRTDIWAAGAVLYEMSTGRRPFHGVQASELSAEIRSKPAPPPRRVNPRVSPRLERLILKCLEKNPERRFPSARLLGTELESMRSRPGTVTRSRRASRAAPGHIRSLAVLPLVNLSGDPEQEYFADGMTEALITSLAKVGALRVISRTSTMQYKGARKPLPEIARELKVDALIEGSVLRAGERVRITAQLIDAVTDQHVWAESYEQNLRHILELQSEVARAVAREIKVAVVPQGRARLARTRPVNPAAYEAHLKGRFHYYMHSPDQIDVALEYFELSRDKDPSYAPAHAGIADVWGVRGVFGFVPPKEAHTRISEALLRAVELDDTLAETHDMLGRFRCFYEWDWAAAEMSFQRAIELDPNYSFAWSFYGYFLSLMGRLQEALPRIQRALELDPFNSFIQGLLGLHLLYLDRYDEAIAEFRKAPATERGLNAQLGLWSAFHKKTMDAEAYAEAVRFFALLGDSDVTRAMERGYTASGYRGAMGLAAESLLARRKESYVQPTRIARLHVHAGEQDQALRWLKTAHDERDPFLVHLRIDSDWDSLRDSPCFQNLQGSMNFPKV